MNYRNLPSELTAQPSSDAKQQADPTFEALHADLQARYIELQNRFAEQQTNYSDLQARYTELISDHISYYTAIRGVNDKLPPSIDTIVQRGEALRRNGASVELIMRNNDLLEKASEVFIRTVGCKTLAEVLATITRDGPALIAEDAALNQ